jgi:hypothetical protein
MPPNVHVANAYGSALAQIIGTADQVVSLEDRKSALASLKSQAASQAIARGADASSLKLVDCEIIPYHYTTNQMARVIITVSGKRSI